MSLTNIIVLGGTDVGQRIAEDPRVKLIYKSLTNIIV